MCSMANSGGSNSSDLGRGRGRGRTSQSRSRHEESPRTSTGLHSTQGVFNRRPSLDVTSPNRRRDAKGSISRNGDEYSISRDAAVPNVNNPLIIHQMIWFG
ncbi:unnamed protein product [Cuscuta epithymum]|uniref:Uncharacterized protein n=1 Tax=Cuscuta epithymum TaxID=186058 RepID=A0AAV0D8H7_9ASTE|nr:unnamed protein product [Cuscuta epithymum]